MITLYPACSQRIASPGPSLPVPPRIASVGRREVLSVMCLHYHVLRTVLRTNILKLLVVAVPDGRGQAAGAGGNGRLVQGGELPVTHQHLPCHDRRGDHTFVEAEEDLPRQVAGGQRRDRLVIHKNEI